MSEAGARERDRVREGEEVGLVIKIDQRAAEELLFNKLSHQVATAEKHFEEVRRHISPLSFQAAALVHEVMKHYTGTLLGGQVVSPLNAEDIVFDRVIQISQMLLSNLNIKVVDFLSKIDKAKMEGRELEDYIRFFLEYPPAAFLALRESINRMVTLVQINAPAPIRPSMLNIKLGYDKV